MVHNENEADDALDDPDDGKHTQRGNGIIESADRERPKRAGTAGDVDVERRQTVIDSQSWLYDANRPSHLDRVHSGHVLPARHYPSRLLTLSPSTSCVSFPTSMSDAGPLTPVAMYDPLDIYGPLLCCPACSPSALLIAPITLHCGHAVCGKHVRKDPSDPSSSSSSAFPRPPSAHRSSSLRTLLAHPRPQDVSSSAVPIVPTCPLPTCQPGMRQHVPTLNIPPESSVTYYPPLVHPAAYTVVIDPVRITVAEPRIDVSICRVLELLEEAQKWDRNQDVEGREAEQSDEGTDVEDKRDEGGECQKYNESNPAGELREYTRLVSPSTSSLERGRGGKLSARVHPLKRLRRCELEDGCHYLSHPRSSRATREELEERFQKELAESLTCEICFMLLFQPVTTPCQHTFCAKCLQRSLDHSSRCPLCRQNMPPFSYFQDHPFNKVVLAILLKAFPESYAERGRLIEDEERDTRLDTPIFVCQLSFPGMPTHLHFFEPRYRLMLRRCLESPSPCFGMIMPPRTVGSSGNNYGTMLDIRSVQMLPDGRSMVETWGTHRFRVLETGTLDGYMVGRIERVDDIPEELEDEAERNIISLLAAQNCSGETSSSTFPSLIAPSTLQPTLEELIAICHAFVEQLRNGTAPWVVQRLNNTYGPMPTDTGSFSFWMAQVLPIDEHEKAKLLVIRSARGRLRLVVHWIEQLNSNWWFSSGCSIS